MASTRIIKCSNCGKEATAKDGTIGNIENQTQYRAVFGMDCDIYWLCPSCKDKAQELAEELISMLGDKHISLSSIVNSER
ncbi:hypothetical protein [Clostridium tertium]|uniref:hypothetical protein n=1 Tax=Clostridium tertium TaxID=1559 RepID=UPI0023B3442E|nr:hypothetical protein [Clostridium tertium]